jgi:hypothetical protein
VKATTEYVETFCSNCVLRVTGDPNAEGADGQGHWQQPFVEVQLISVHRCIDGNSRQSKLRRVRAALRSEPLPWLEFYAREELDAFIAGLVRARDAAFGVSEPHEEGNLPS